MILAPAGDTHTFLAAIAAGADAVYCGLKIFSARMGADNFSIEELAQLTELAHEKQVKVYVALNTIIKESELEKTKRILSKLAHFTAVDALIIQDPAVIPMARQVGFTGEFHLSTLGNCTQPTGLLTAQRCGFSRVVLPREFNLDEIRTMAAAAPENLDLEVFIHGALCYSVSGRCYWSSWFGGKSALRGRCVQPCRRIYQQKNQKQRHFSCTDFSTDVLVKVLKEIPKISTWKIEGRKKSPHYVYYAVKAYKLLRDDPKKKKDALSWLEYAMGREFTHYNLLSHRVINPLAHGSETGSGMLLGRVKNPNAPYFNTREALFTGDLLRIGYEEDRFHNIQRVTRAIPKRGKFFLSQTTKGRIKKGTPVFIIDRRGSELNTVIGELEKELSAVAPIHVRPIKTGSFKGKKGAVFNRRRINAGRSRKKQRPFDMAVYRGKTTPDNHFQATGMWISAGGYSMAPVGRAWLWVDPLLFPEEETICRRYLASAVKKGAKNFVLNAPWQIAMFSHPDGLNIWAGPFCNITNANTLEVLKHLGFSGAVVSPELDRDNFLELPQAAALPLGVVVQANWPLAISRVVSPDLELGKAFFSPKGEAAWTTKSNTTYYTYPNWSLDLTSKKEELAQAGYTMFVHLNEKIPKSIKMKSRAGLWNWHLKLL